MPTEDPNGGQVTQLVNALDARPDVAEVRLGWNGSLHVHLCTVRRVSGVPVEGRGNNRLEAVQNAFQALRVATFS